MTDFSTLQKHTDTFFAMHWDKSSRNDPPAWSRPWYFIGEVPHNTHKGCYSWLKGKEVLYIGLALNSGQQGYEVHSLGTRITRYWKTKKGEKSEKGEQKYAPTEQLAIHSIDSIITLPFPEDDQEYLAAALEVYLIRKLKPALNKIHK